MTIWQIWSALTLPLPSRRQKSKPCPGGVAHRNSDPSPKILPHFILYLAHFITRKSNEDVYEDTHIINRDNSLIYKPANQ